MRVIECSPYYNEADLLALKVKEGESWVDEFRVSESSHTFKYQEKGFNLATNSEKVHHIKVDGSKHFIENYIGFRRKFPFITKKHGAWRNEATQRNLASCNLEVASNDIVIFSDIDEIIDARNADYLIEMVKKHQIITIKLHFTMFYMNLFSLNWHEVWPGSPPDYSYRTFLMTGDYYNKLKWSSDKLRHMGEASKFIKTIHCPEQFMGFHHSWLGSEEDIYNKLMSYAHDLKDHGQELMSAYESGNLKEYISLRLNQRKSIFSSHELEKRNLEDVKWLNTISANRKSYEQYFIK